MAEVTLEGVNKVYDNGFHAVHDLDLNVKDSEFLVLVGPSGCGKSTALRMVAGLESITGGTLSIGDRVVNDVAPKDRDIAFVFQNYALYPHMTVRQNIGFALKLRKVPGHEIDSRVAEAARLLELTEYLDTKPGQLSGGQRQRVAMGRAIVRRPQVFLMDEPLSNLDAKLRVQMRAEISRLQHDIGVTTVYVTHDQIEAMTMGHRVAVMSKGYLMQVDTPQNLYDDPDNLFVATFIGSPQMNLVLGTLHLGDGAGSARAAGSGGAGGPTGGGSGSGGARGPTGGGAAGSGAGGPTGGGGSGGGAGGPTGGGSGSGGAGGPTGGGATGSGAGGPTGGGGSGDGGPHVSVGRHRLALTPAVLAARPALRALDGAEVVVGVRPEDLEDAALVGEGPGGADRFLDVVVELREGLGAEVVAHARLEAQAPQVETAQRDPNATLTGKEGVELVARLDPRTQIVIDDPLRLAVNVDKLHFFDPATGNAIRV